MSCLMYMEFALLPRSLFCWVSQATCVLLASLSALPLSLIPMEVITTIANFLSLFQLDPDPGLGRGLGAGPVLSRSNFSRAPG